MSQQKGTYVLHQIDGKGYYYRHFWDPEKKSVKAVREDPPNFEPSKPDSLEQVDIPPTQGRKSAKLSQVTHQRLKGLADEINGSIDAALAVVLANHDRTLVLEAILKKMIPSFIDKELNVAFEDAEEPIVLHFIEEVQKNAHY